MKRFSLFALVALVVAMLAGCFQTDIHIKVNPDGSGTLVQTVLIRKDVMNQMRAMAQSFAQEGQPPEELKLLDDEEMKETAKKFGEGVTYAKGEEINTENFEGYKAFFDFKDINKLNVDQNPNGSLPSDDSEEKAPQEFITFTFKKGKTSNLTITMPQNDAEKASKPEEEKKETPSDGAEQKTDGSSDQQQEQMMMAMMQEMMKGMKVGISVEVNCNITDTNATFQKDNQVVIMDIDFDKLLAAEKEFKEFVKTNPETMSEAKELMKSIPGMQMEMEKVVTIKFK